MRGPRAGASEPGRRPLDISLVFVYIYWVSFGAPMAMSRADLLILFQETATEVGEKDFPSLAEDTAIGELGIDSLGMLEIIGSMERRLRIALPDEALAGVRTVRELVDLVYARQDPAKQEGAGSGKAKGTRSGTDSTKGAGA